MLQGQVRYSLGDVVCVACLDADAVCIFGHADAGNSIGTGGVSCGSSSRGMLSGSFVPALVMLNVSRFLAFYGTSLWPTAVPSFMRVRNLR